MAVCTNNAVELFDMPQLESIWRRIHQFAIRRLQFFLPKRQESERRSGLGPHTHTTQEGQIKSALPRQSASTI